MKILGLIASIRFRLALLIAPELGEQVRTDPLTGAYNRRAFDEHLARELAATNRGNHPVGLLMVDLNDFKSVNDTYGHEVGDAALRLVAKVIREHVRGTDVVCRYGGDEFAVLLHAPIDGAGVLTAAERIVAALAERQIETSKGPIRVMISIGGAIAFGTGGLDSLVDRADKNLYEAKKLKGDSNSHAAV